MTYPHIESEIAEQMTFTSSVLGTIFRIDPSEEVAELLLKEMAEFDFDEWVFGNRDDIYAASTLIENGLSAGIPNVALTEEYRRLFVGPAALPAPPWGSVYMDRECVIFGDTTLKQREWMRSNGVAVNQEIREPEDHLGTQLLLLSWLLENRPELALPFLHDHILIWADHFLEQLQAAAQQDFYEGIALLTRTTLADWQKRFNLSVEPRKFYR